jgi:VIT1/CCC1 family predicted Fe2+/Mn2+ transporter
MLILMLSVLLAVLVIGTAALVGHPLSLVAVGVVLAATVLLLARRSGERSTARRNP